MIMIKHAILILFFVIMAARLPASGQTFEAGVMAGTTFYLGDMQPYNTPADLFTNIDYAGGIFFRYNLNEHIAFRSNLLYAQIQGINTGPYDMPVTPPDNEDHDHFNTRLAELSILAEVNFFPYVAGDLEKRATPFIFGGTGVMLFEEPFSGGYKIRPKYIPSKLILGIGGKLNISRRFSVGVEWGMRRTDDMLDGVYYPHDTVTGVTGIPDDKDWYSFTGMTLSFKFQDASGAICPH